MAAELLGVCLTHQGKGCTFTRTAAAKERLCTPSSYVVCERSHADVCVGVRLSVLRTSDHAEISKVATYLAVAACCQGQSHSHSFT